MTKKMIQAFVNAEYKALGAKDNKERLKYIVAGCKDGHLYSHDGTDYGMFNADAPDTVFVPESDLELSRITGSKIAGITIKMQKFFAEYGDNDGKSDGDGSGEPEEDTPKKTKGKENVEAEATDESADEPDIDAEAVEKEIKKAIKKSKFKKAQKLIDKLDADSAKSWQKKLDKAQ